jgi:hypothetical protein
MKVVLSILLLFVTGIYILPVKEHLNNTVTCSAEMDTDKEETNKKEKEKELFTYSTPDIYFTDSYSSVYEHLSFTITVPLHTVETPPPDLA